MQHRQCFLGFLCRYYALTYVSRFFWSIGFDNLKLHLLFLFLHINHWLYFSFRLFLVLSFPYLLQDLSHHSVSLAAECFYSEHHSLCLTTGVFFIQSHIRKHILENQYLHKTSASTWLVSKSRLSSLAFFRSSSSLHGHKKILLIRVYLTKMNTYVFLNIHAISHCWFILIHFFDKLQKKYLL